MVLSCTLKKSPDASNTGQTAEVVATRLRDKGVGVESFRVVGVVGVVATGNEDGAHPGKVCAVPRALRAKSIMVGE